jgi:hypothetical protein
MMPDQQGHAMKVVQLTNSFGGRFAYCAEHMTDHRANMAGDVTETVVDGECPDCQLEANWADAPRRMREAMLDARCHHTRFQPRFGGTVYAYFSDPSSPSGFMLAEALDARRFDALVDELRASGQLRGLSPLSPTEHA